MDAGDWASWVQAIGSIAAVWFAGKLARDQFANEQRLQREAAQYDMDRVYLGIRAVAEATERPVLRVLEVLLKREMDEIIHAANAESIMYFCEDAVAAIPIDIAGSHEFIEAVIGMKILLKEVRGILEKGKEKGGYFFVMDNPFFEGEVKDTQRKAGIVFEAIKAITQPAFNRS